MPSLRSCSLSPGGSPRGPRAAGGLLDLRGWDFAAAGPLLLDGEWDFFPGELLSGDQARSASSAAHRKVPDLWRGSDAGGEGGRGAGTYRLRVLLPPNAGRLGLRYTTASTAFELEANGEPVASAGKPDADPEQARPAYKPGVASLPEAEALDLVVRVSNHEYRVGGLWRPLALGPVSVLEAGYRNQVALTYVECSALISLGLCFVFFFLNRRQQLSFLYFALFVGSIACRTLVTGDYVLTRMVNLDFGLLIRFEYLTVFFPAPMGVLFFWYLFPREMPRKVLHALTVPALVLELLVLVLPLGLLTRTIGLAYAHALLCILAVGFWILGPAVLRRREDAVIELVGAMVLLAFAVNDMLHASFLIQTGNYMAVGLVAFVMIQSYVLSRRFSAALAAAEILAAEKDLLLREIHHRVKNSLQIVSSAIALQAHRSEDAAVVAALSAARARIRAISLVHEKLYALDAPGPVDLGAYARDLARQLEMSYRRDDGRVELEVSADPIRAHHDLCIDLGLVMAELLSNAYRHALGGKGCGSRLRVELRREGPGFLLRVADDGPGFPRGFSFESSGGMGLKVASSLARKRGGSITLNDGPGAVIELRMPIPAGAPEDYEQAADAATES